MAEITISLPDGSERSLPQGATATTLAESIGSRLAKAAVAAVVNGDEPDDARLTVLFAQLCELGRRFGMRFHIEPTPWTGLKTLAQASRIVAAAGQPNGKVMVDTIHVDRVGNTAADIAAAVEAESKVALDRKKLHVDHVKTTGTYQATARLHADVEFPITFEVVAK